MKVLFIYPNKVMVNRMPLGIGYMSSHLKREGHQVRVFDTTFIKCSDIENDEKLREAALQVQNPDLNEFGLVAKEVDPFAEFIREIREFKPDIVGMTAVDPNYNFGIKFLQIVKEKLNNVVTVVGGSVATFSPEEVISEDCVDIICVGEGEEAICELANKMENGNDYVDIKNLWVKNNGKIYRNEIRSLLDINEILAPDLSLFDDRLFMRPLGGKMYRMVSVIWTRGCAFNCTYCANSALIETYKGKGGFYRIKKPEILIKELEDCKNKYNLNFIGFMDDIFPIHKPEIIDKFCVLYKKHVKLPFSVNLQPTLVKEDQFVKIVDAGCRNIAVGLESGNPEIRKNILGRNYKDDDVIRVFDLANKYKIRSSTFNMIGIPDETREDIFKTIELNRKANPSSATVTFFHPYRGSALRELCIKRKYFNPAEENKFEDMYRIESRLNLPTISKTELKNIFQSFQLYLKLPKKFYDLIKLSEDESSPESKRIRSETLLPEFYKIVEAEPKWDFRTSAGG